MKKDFQPEQMPSSEPQPIVLPTATDSAKHNVICSQSNPFVLSPNGFLEAINWLKNIGEWERVTTKGFSTDGYSVVQEANSIWLSMYSVKFNIEISENIVFVQTGDVRVEFDKVNFMSMLMQTDNYKYAKALSSSKQGSMGFYTISNPEKLTEEYVMVSGSKYKDELTFSDYVKMGSKINKWIKKVSSD
jgi:hypothetical protein